MTTRVRLLKLQEERGAPLKTQLRVKRKRKLGHTDPKAKRRTLPRRMRSKVNTRQRKEINLKAAAKAETRGGGQKAERRITSIKVMTKEVAQRAKIEMLQRKRRSLNLIIVKIEIKVTSLIKSIGKTPKEEMVRELGQSHEARKEQPQKTGADLIAGTGIGVDLQFQKTKKKDEKKTKTGAESEAGVRTDDTTVKGTIRSVEHPGIRTTGQEVQTETSRETRTEAGAPEARATRETTAKIGRLIERTETETLPTKGEDAAAARRAIETRRGRVRRAQIPDETEGVVPPGPKTDEVHLNQDQIVRKAETETTARGINQAPAPALTATDDKGAFKSLFYTHYPCCVQHQLSI